ncbi:MAG: VTC domain-containing protein [Kiritimatiellae bacterium]|nr:VTC domain-containing protein [Kiritimatiellia bacterium]
MSIWEQELKFTTANTQARKLAAWLHCRCARDGLFPDGRVASVYFDTQDRGFLAAKTNSDFLKTKVRVRWYRDFHTGAPGARAFLEVKWREGATRRKLRLESPFPVGWIERADLRHPRWLEVNDLLTARGVALPGTVRPLIAIAYRRQRFVERATTTRVSVDFDICAERHVGVRPAQPWPAYLPQAVVELKGHLPELPPALAPLTDMGCVRGSFSKYRECCRRMLGDADIN